MWAKPAQPQPQGNSVRQPPAPALAPDLSCPLSQPLGKGEGSSEVPVSCSADLATQKPVLKALTTCASVSPHEWCDGALGARAAPRVLGTMQEPGTTETWHKIEHKPTLGAGAEALGWAGGRWASEGRQHPQSCQHPSLSLTPAQPEPGCTP